MEAHLIKNIMSIQDFEKLEDIHNDGSIQNNLKKT